MNDQGSRASTRSRSGRFRRILSQCVALTLASSTLTVLASSNAVVASGTACGSAGTPTVIALADPNFYIDSGVTPDLDSTFAGYTIRNTATARSGLEVRLSGFSDPGEVIQPVNGQPTQVSLPTLASNASTTAYFLLRATGPTLLPQTHTISLLENGSVICSRTFTYTRVAETIKALANKVRSVNFDGSDVNSANVGDLVIATVKGVTGILGSGPTYDPGVLSYAPSAFSEFDANAWRLERTEMTISPDGLLPQRTYVDQLYLSGASGVDREYTAKYYFRAIDSISTRTVIQPVQYIASGTQVKHTNIPDSSSGSLPPVVSDSKIVLTKTGSPGEFLPSGSNATGGTVTYTVTGANSGTTTGTIDRIIDTLPGGAEYVANSARIGGRAITPVISGTIATGQILTFYGPFSVGAGGRLLLTFDAVIPATPGTYRNSVLARFGQIQIDSTVEIDDNAPAITDTFVRFPGGAVDALDDSATGSNTNPATNVTIDVLANDVGAGIAVESTLARFPSSGTATVNPDGTITYTPLSGFGGVDSFDYRVSNGQTSDVATVKISIPKANYDEYSVNKPDSPSLGALPIDIASASGVKANDFCSTDTPALTNTCTILTSTTWVPIPGTLQVGNTAYRGTLTMQSTGGFSYTPPAKNDMLAAPNNYVEFTYVLTDSANNTATGHMRIYFRNIAPDTAVTPYVTPVGVNLASGDTCYDSSGRQVATCTDFSVSGLQLQPNIDGTVVIDPAGTSTAVYTPRLGFWGLDVFYYSVMPGSSRIPDNPVTVLVGPPPATINTGFGESVEKTFTDTTYISDHGNVLSGTVRTVACSGCTYSISQAPTKGSVELQSYLADGVTHTKFLYTPDPSVSGQDVFFLGVTSPSGLFVTSPVTVNIGPRAVDDTYSVLAKSELTFNVLDNDNCPDTCSIQMNAPTKGTLTSDPSVTGRYTYVNNVDVGPIVFSYTIQTTAAIGSSQGTVTIQVEGAEDDEVTMLPSESARTINVRANDPCLDCAISLVSQPAIGTATLNSNGTITYIPPPTFAGVVTFFYGLSKGGSTTQAKVTVIVPPRAIDDIVYAEANTELSIDPIANDICSDCRVTSTVSGTIVDNGFAISYTPNQSIDFDYTITDSTGLTSTATISIIVSDPPVAVDDSATGPAGAALLIDVAGGVGNDTCPGTGPPQCTFIIVREPETGTASLAVDYGTLRYTPVGGFTGRVTFDYAIVAPSGLSDTARVTVDITPIAASDFATSGPDATISIDVVANDICDGCSLSIHTAPDQGTATVDGTSVNYTAPNQPGTYTFRYTITEVDTDPDSSVEGVLVTVVVGNASPDFVATPHGSPVTIQVTNNDVACATSCSVSSVNRPGDASFTSSSVTFTPPTGFSGLTQLMYTITFGSGSTATASITILVGPAPIERLTDINVPISGNLLVPVLCSTCTTEFRGVVGQLSGLSIAATNELAGDVTVAQDGDYTYQPAEDWSGTDSPFEYSVTDQETGLTTTGIVTVSVASLTPSFTITKTGTANFSVGTPAIEPGDKIGYQYVLTNTGDFDISDIAVIDDRISAADISCGGDSDNVVEVLPASNGTSQDHVVTCTAQYSLTQADIDAGGVTNIVTATGQATVTDESGNPSTVQPTDSATATVNVPQTASVSIQKTHEPVVDNDADPNDTEGDSITYHYTVSNTGNVTLRDFIVNDDKIDNDSVNLVCTGRESPQQLNVISVLLPSESLTCSAVYNLTASDVAADEVTNTVAITANGPEGGSQPSPASSSITVLLNQPVSIEVIKEAVLPTVPGGVPKPGDMVTYTFTVRNTGEERLVNIELTDPIIDEATISCIGGTGNVISSLERSTNLDDSDQTTCSGTYELTQNDVDFGSVSNTATVRTNYTPAGGFITSTLTDTDTLQTAIGQFPGITIDNVFSAFNASLVAPDDRVDTGDVAIFTYTVTNTGNTTLTNILVVSNAGTVDCNPLLAGNQTTIDELAVGSELSCTATRSILQTEIAATLVEDTAQATVDSLEVTASATATITRVPAISLVKSASPVDDLDSNGIDPGDTIEYSISVTNTGNLTLGNVEISDPLLSTSLDCGSDDTGLQTSIEELLVGETILCSGTYEITEAAWIDATISNVASVTALPQFTEAETISASDTQTVDLSTANFTVTKSATPLADVDSNGIDEGDTLSYTFTIVNTGNIALESLDISDDIISTGIDCDSETEGYQTSIPALPPAASASCSAEIALTSSQFRSASLTNTATVTARYVDSDQSKRTLEKSDSHTSRFEIARVTVVNQHGPIVDDDANGVDAEDLIPLTFTVTNSGNVDLSNVVVVTDDGLEIDCDSIEQGIQNSIPLLNVGDSVLCTATHLITEADLTVEQYANTAAASTTHTYSGDSDPTNVTAQDSAATPLEAVSLTVSKASTLITGSNGRQDAGDTIQYTITIANTGTSALSNIDVSDPLIADSLDCDTETDGLQTTIASLGSARSIDCRGTYSISQSDLDSGLLTNTVTATTDSISETASVTIEFDRQPSLSLQKSGSLDNTVVGDSDTSDVGDLILYEILVENSGNVSVDDVTIIDDLDSVPPSLDCDWTNVANPDSRLLAPGQSVMCSFSFSLTSSDVANQSVTNTATVSGHLIGEPGVPVGDSDSHVSELEGDPPRAIADDVSAPMGSIVEIDVLANDVGDGRSIDSFTPPDTGEVEVVEDKLVFTPELMYLGPATFTYTMRSGDTTGEATITVDMVENPYQPRPEMFLDLDADGSRDLGEPGVTNTAMRLDLNSRLRYRTSTSVSPLDMNRRYQPISVTPIRNPSDVRMSAALFVEGAASSSLLSNPTVATTSTDPIASFACVTGSTGVCINVGLPAGTFRISTAFDPGEFGLTTTADPDDDGDLVSDTFPDLESGTMRAVAFGFAGLGTLFGRVYEDGNNSGAYDSTDRTFPNALLRITWDGIDQQLGTADDVVIELATNEVGAYEIRNLPAGSYKVALVEALDGVDQNPSPEVGRLEIQGSTAIDLVVYPKRNDAFPGDPLKLPGTGNDPLHIVRWALTSILIGITILRARRRSVRPPF